MNGPPYTPWWLLPEASTAAGPVASSSGQYRTGVRARMSASRPTLWASAQSLGVPDQVKEGDAGDWHGARFAFFVVCWWVAAAVVCRPRRVCDAQVVAGRVHRGGNGFTEIPGVICGGL